ncbi:hypothetical protein GCM10009642_65760 [Nocardiopsis metallicus]
MSFGFAVLVLVYLEAAEWGRGSERQGGLISHPQVGSPEARAVKAISSRGTDRGGGVGFSMVLTWPTLAQGDPARTQPRSSGAEGSPGHPLLGEHGCAERAGGRWVAER